MTVDSISNIHAREMLERSLHTMLITVNVRSQFFDQTKSGLANEDTFMEVADNLRKQLQFHCRGEISQVNIKARKLSSKERLIYELISD